MEKVDVKKPTYKEAVSPEGETYPWNCVAAEHHLTFTYENGKPPGTYLTRTTIPILSATGYVLAQETLSVLQENDGFGRKSGLVIKLEKKNSSEESAHY